MKLQNQNRFANVVTSAVASWSGLDACTVVASFDATRVRAMANPATHVTASDPITGVAVMTAKRSTLLVPSRAPSPPV